MARYNVYVPNEKGALEVYPMKKWLQQNPTQVPEGLDGFESHSHQLRRGLEKVGWSIRESAGEVKLIMPDSSDQSTINEVLGDEETEENCPPHPSFAYERHLRDFLASNLPSIPINGKRLRLFVDPMGQEGIEYPAGNGRIDLLCIDDQSNLVVFELKRDESSDRAIGQLARYMGWVKLKLGSEVTVSGVVVAGTISPNLRYSVSVIPNISLFEYEVSFHLKPVEKANA